ncbi:Uracil phosphoribosyltransferase [Indibacter alkaliphilus LW1]|uniref:Uracil phosphoribosyltransferase n=1 Tax=Indibacter alkaliphilus (strain CCUG 57479 / KCTC 22604 / LW1) TaxID=1189612 RepID=S2DL91_INDAL|nr:uracil phosphoribosyltransferase [Indibacter alkaliphilus]EOZ99717.1 Uracil phosphoribosyltransferase [Indibacter alkaliphilus LW1]
MKISNMFVLSNQNSIVDQYLSELRDVNIQQDRARFRKNLERIGELLAYELSKSLTYKSKVVETPIESTEVKVLGEQPLLICVLRASMPFFQGFLNIFNEADSGFVGVYRQEDGADLDIEFLYQATPDITGRELILIDPMLATGKSIVKTVNNLEKMGKPKSIHIVGVIAAPEGLAYISNEIKTQHKIWVAEVDRALNEKSYIVPGLGDAGDLAFGPKL